MLYEFTRDYEIPDGGITDQFRLNSYASFSIELINMVKVDNKLIRVYDFSEFEGEKEYEEEIDVIDDDGNTIKAVKKVKKNVLSFTSKISTDDKVMKDGTIRPIKHKRKLPKIDDPIPYVPVPDPQDKPSPPKKPIEVKPPKNKTDDNNVTPVKDEKLKKKDGD